jgi:ElaB/YqjD/DUF883 family membrane-anchored ribosome-binding protein
MESSITADLLKSGQTLADKAADKVQGGIRDARHAAKASIVRYTKKNPMTALMIAAASGALLLGLINLLKPSRAD